MAAIFKFRFENFETFVKLISIILFSSMLLLSPKAETPLRVFVLIFGSVNSIWSFYTINSWLQGVSQKNKQRRQNRSKVYGFLHSQQEPFKPTDAKSH